MSDEKKKFIKSASLPITVNVCNDCISMRMCVQAVERRIFHTSRSCGGSSVFAKLKRTICVCMWILVCQASQPAAETASLGRNGNIKCEIKAKIVDDAGWLLGTARTSV